MDYPHTVRIYNPSSDGAALNYEDGTFVNADGGTTIYAGDADVQDGPRVLRRSRDGGAAMVGKVTGVDAAAYALFLPEWVADTVMAQVKPDVTMAATPYGLLRVVGVRHLDSVIFLK